MVLVHARALLTSTPHGATEPGVVTCSHWRPGPSETEPIKPVMPFGGMARIT